MSGVHCEAGSSERSQACLQLCVRGREAGRFALLLLSPLLAFLGHQEKALTRKDRWQLGVGGAGCLV